MKNILKTLGILLILATYTKQSFASDFPAGSYQALKECIYISDIECFKKQLKHKPDLSDKPNFRSKSLLMEALKLGRAEFVILILDTDSRAEHLNRTYFDMNVFTYSAKEVSFNMFKYLVQRFPHLALDYNSMSGQSTFEKICEDDSHTSIRKFLLYITHDQSYLSQKSLDKTIEKCIYSSNTQTIKFLISQAKKYNKNYIPSNNNHLLNAAATTSGNLETLKLLVELNSSSEFFWHKAASGSSSLESALNIAPQRLQSEAIFLLSQINKEDLYERKSDGGKTFLHIAMKKRNLEAVQMILDLNRNDPELFLMRDNEGKLPMLFTPTSSDTPVRRILFGQAPTEVKKIYIEECYESTKDFEVNNARAIRLFCEQLKSSMTNTIDLNEDYL